MKPQITDIVFGDEITCTVTIDGQSFRYTCSGRVAANVRKIVSRWPVTVASVLASIVAASR